MASQPEVIPSAEFRRELEKRGGQTASRCYQCATCTSVCQLSPEDDTFPRRQMLWAQWGLGDRLAGDPGVWLCHQCNDCTTRCPRDAKPGDVMSVARSLAIEKLAWPGFMGKLVGKAGVTWPLLLGLPFVFWIVVLYALHGFSVPPEPLVYHEFVPHWLIYVVYITGLGGALVAVGISALRFWKLLGRGRQRKGSFIGELVPALIDVATHARFAKCGTAGSRRWGHFATMWGFVLAALASFFIVVAMYGFGTELPLAQTNWMKILGNVAAALLVVGGIWLLAHRLQADGRAGATRAFDSFFLAVVLLVIATGVLTELARLFWVGEVAVWIYVLHLTSVLCLFVTLPYSKFAHMIYRTLAMVHERMAAKS